MKCTNCLRKKFTKINVCQDYRICKIQKNKTMLTKNNIGKWCEHIYDTETEDKMEINTENNNNIIKEIQNLKI